MIHDQIGHWHDICKDCDTYPPLHEYLGLSHEEYEVWLYEPFALPSILLARRTGTSLVEIMAERFKELRAAGSPTDGTILFFLSCFPYPVFPIQFPLGNRLKAQSAIQIAGGPHVPARRDLWA